VSAGILIFARESNASFDTYSWAAAATSTIAGTAFLASALYPPQRVEDVALLVAAHFQSQLARQVGHRLAADAAVEPDRRTVTRPASVVCFPAVTRYSSPPFS
jgi:hypothetical protein